MTGEESHHDNGGSERLVRTATDGKAVIGPSSRTSASADLQVFTVYDQAGRPLPDKLGVAITADDLDNAATIVVDKPDWLTIEPTEELE